MTDHLAEIAAMTVECKDNFHEKGWACRTCSGYKVVLDPRFDGLREMHGTCHFKDCPRDEDGDYSCGGWRINRDLGVIVEIMIRKSPVFIEGMGEHVRVRWELFQGTVFGEGDFPLEAAAHAVYEWLLQEQKARI